MRVKIKELAKSRKNYSLYKLAQVLGVPQQTVYSWARGRTQPNFVHMDELCAALECSMCELFIPDPVDVDSIALNRKRYKNEQERAKLCG